MFGVMDGHGGDKCVNFVKEMLFNEIVKEANFCENPKQSITNSCLKIEKLFL
jgi:serine/threonine protein phosphatase PrpC